MTTGHDGCANGNSNDVLIKTKTSEKVTAFKDCVDPQTDFESGEWVAKTIIAQMEKVIEVEKSVEKCVQALFVMTFLETEIQVG